jgi:spermidine/putrescine transport system substrate-binding protein
MRAEIAVNITLEEKYATANAAAQKLLPPNLRDNRLLYPDKEILKRGQFQTDVGVEALQLYEKYWTMLKVGG